MKKKVVSLVLATAMLATLAGCGESGSGNAGGSAAMDEIKINIWDNNQKNGLQQIADKWTETSGVKVSIEVVDWDNYWTLLEAGASGGEMPDVFWMHSNTAQMYMENGILLDLTDYIASDDSVSADKYYEGVWNLYNSDGKQYALPKDHDTIALLYNKAIFDQYNVEYPTDDWTWEDMYEAAKTITEESNGDVYGMAMNTSNNQDGWYNLVYDYGAQVITDDHKGTTIGSDEGKAGMEMVRKLLSVGAPQTVVAETGTDSLFLSGKTAMITQGSWMINTFYTAENSADYAWAMLPYADTNDNGTCDEGERYSAYNGLGWAAAANTKNPDAAFEGMDVSAFVRAEEEGELFFRPYTRKTTVWEDALQQAGAFLDAWQSPDDPAVMAKACDNAQKIIEDAIAAE